MGMVIGQDRHISRYARIHRFLIQVKRVGIASRSAWVRNKTHRQHKTNKQVSMYQPTAIDRPVSAKQLYIFFGSLFKRAGGIVAGQYSLCVVNHMLLMNKFPA